MYLFKRFQYLKKKNLPEKCVHVPADEAVKFITALFNKATTQ